MRDGYIIHSYIMHKWYILKNNVYVYNFFIGCFTENVYNFFTRNDVDMLKYRRKMHKSTNKPFKPKYMKYARIFEFQISSIWPRELGLFRLFYN